MTDKSGNIYGDDFHRQLTQKLEELIGWTLSNSPLDSASLTRDDFTDLQKRFVKLAMEGNAFAREPEPSEGGAQYIQVTPAPWP